ncbi:MAG: class I SAM-dependent methyltransferase [Chloroflexota bacterium]
MTLRRFRFFLSYFGRPPWDSGLTPPELYEYLRAHPPGRAIDLGCGTGTNVLALAQGGWQVVGVDFVPRAVKLAKQKIKKADLHADLRVGDVTRLDGIAGPFDLALDIGCFHGVDDKAAYLSELTRLLAPGGHWLLYAFFRPPALRQTQDNASPPSGPGLVEADLTLIHARGFSLLSRADGFDKKNRPSAWFLFQR